VQLGSLHRLLATLPGAVTATVFDPTPPNRSEAVAGLNARLGLPERLIPDLTEAATKDHCAETNPRGAGVGDYEALLREAMG
jgi:hypothetical protein